MDNHLAQKPRAEAGPLYLVLVCAPVIVGTASIYLWFIPNPHFSLAAGIIGGGYILLVLGLALRSRGTSFREISREQGGGIKPVLMMSAGALLLGFASYLVVARAIPAEYTRFFGQPSDRSFSVTEIFRHTSKASALCPYTITLQSIDGGTGTDMCVDWDAVHRFHIGDKVRLHGWETRLGFKFDSYDVMSGSGTALGS